MVVSICTLKDAAVLREHAQLPAVPWTWTNWSNLSRYRASRHRVNQPRDFRRTFTYKKTKYKSASSIQTQVAVMQRRNFYLMKFRYNITGIHMLREALYDALRYPENGAMQVRLYSAAKKNSKLLENTTDPILCYFLFEYQDRDIIPSSDVSAWLRASRRSRRRMRFVNGKLSSRKSNVKSFWDSIPVDVSLNVHPDDDCGSQLMFKKLRVKQFDDLTKLNPADWTGVASCATYAASAPKLSRIRERLAYAKIHNAHDYQIVGKYIDLYGKTKLVLKRNQRTATPQADFDDAHGTGTVSVDASQNVAITTARDTSGEVLPRIPTWVEMSSEDVIGRFPELMDRWLPIGVTTWTISQGLGANIATYELPRDAIRATANADVINYIPFYSHQYWRGDMHIRVELNANKFMVGQVQIAFYYGMAYDANGELHKNIYSLSQCQHGILDAGGSNSVELVIPFRHHSAMVATSPTNKEKHLYVGTLLFHVLSPLSVGERGGNSCSFVTYLRFANSEFTGQISRAISGVPQMESALVMAGAMKLLDTVASDRNRDNPPGVISPAYIVPTATHSWAAGTNAVDVLHPMRLDIGGQTRHPSGIANENFERVNDIARVFGLITYGTWFASQPMGSSIFTREVRPGRTPTDERDPNVLFKTVVSPVEVMASMFGQWRGSLEYRFDFIASQFHTGRVLVAYIPNASVDKTYTLDQAKSSYNVVFDLHEKRSFTFIAPYVSNDPWARRRENMDGSDVHYCQCGKLVMFVLVPLVAPRTVPQSVNLNIYMRAGPSFETSILIQPTLGLALDNRTKTGDFNTLTPPAGMKPMYLGTWDGYYSDGGCVLRWGTLAGRVVEFPGESYWINPTHADVDMYWESTEDFVLTVDKASVNVRYFAVIKYGDVFHAVGCPSSANAISLWKAYMAGDSTWHKYYGTWNTFSPSVSEKCVLKRHILTGVAQMERMMSEISLGGIRQLPSTSSGRYYYGEDFSRLKDLCRRYQLLGTSRVAAHRSLRGEFALLKFSAKPMGLRLDLGTETNPNYVANKCREGIIPLILSGFRYFRGSLRYRLVMPPNISQYVWIQHRPDIVTNLSGIVDATAKEDDLCMQAHGYAMYVQHTDINGIVEFEIPFYQTGVYGLLNEPATAAEWPYTSLGTIFVGVNSPEALTTDVQIQIYYALADDFNFNTFQGFPNLVDSSNVAIAPAATRINRTISPTDFEVMGTDSIEECTCPRSGSSQMMSWVTNMAKSTVKEAVTEASEEVKVLATEAINKVHNAGMGQANQQILINIISNAAHIAQNCTVSSIVTGLLSILASIGLKLYEYVSIAKNFVIAVMKRLGYISTKEPSDTSPVRFHVAAEAICMPSTSGTLPILRSATSQSPSITEEDTPIIVEWLTAIYTAICAAIGFSARKQTDPPLTQWANFLSKDMGNCARSGSAILVFVKSHLRIFRKITDWIMYQFNPDVSQLALFSGASPVVKIWVEEALYLIDVDVRAIPVDNALYIERLSACELFGRELQVTFAGIDHRRGTTMVGTIERLYLRVQKLLQAAIKLGVCPYLRVKPLHVQFHGRPGVGKSSMVRDVVRYLLELQGQKIDTPNYFLSVSAASKYWEQCEGNQPAVIMDDLWAVNTQNVIESQLVTYFELYGDIPFTPPRAEADKKKERISPTVFISTTNYPQQVFPDVDEYALKRRRDLLIEVEAAELDPEGHPGCPHCLGATLNETPVSHLSDFHHLIFYENKIFGKDDASDRIGQPMTWLQFREMLKNRLMPIWQKNLAVYKRDIDKLVHTNAFDDVGTIEERIERSRKRMALMYRQKHLTMFESISDSATKIQDWIKHRWGIGITPDSIVDMSHYSIANEYIDVLSGSSEGETTTLIMPDATDDLRLQYEKRFGILPERDLDTIIVNTGRLYPGCIHCSADMLESIFVGGNYEYVNLTDPFSDETGKLNEDIRCESWCILNTPWKQIWMEAWLGSGPVKRGHVINRTPNRVPKIFGGARSREEQQTRLNKIFGGIKNQYISFTDKLMAEDSTLMRAIKYIGQLITTVSNFIGKWLHIITPIIAFIGVACAGWWGYKKLDSGESASDIDSDLRMINFGNSESKAYNVEPVRQAKRSVLRFATTEAGVSQQANVVERLIRRNACYITCSYIDDCGNTRNVKFMCLMLYERRCLMQRHYLETLQDAPENKVIRFRWVEDNGRMAFNPELGIEMDILDLKRTYCEYERGRRDSNFVIVDMPAAIPCVKNITKFIATNAAHAHLSRKVLFVRPGASSVMVDMMIRRDGLTINGLPDNRFSGPINMDMTYEYEMSMPGYCGSIIMDMSLEKPIIGMHVAGIDGCKMGVAERMVSETFHTQPSRKTPVVDISDLELEPIDLSQIDINSMVFGQGIVPPKLAASQSGETRYVKSLLHNKILPNATEPMPLTKHDPRMRGLDPLELGCAKHGLASCQFKRKIVDEAREHYQHKILTLCKPLRQEVKLLTYQEAICGIPDRIEYAPLEWSSSEGFPFSKYRPAGCKSKLWLFEFDETINGKQLKKIYEPLKDMLAAEYHMRKNGIQCDVINVDCLKDTCETFEKARTPGKTRVFSTCPIQYLIAFKRYFGDFMAAFKATRIFTEHGIGINVDGAQWSQLARYLQEVGPSIMAGDYSHFGYTLNSDFMRAAFDIMLAWYDKYSTSDTHDEDQIVRGVIASEAINPQHLARNLLYQTQCGMSSGFPATEIMNTMVNCMYVRAAWLDMLKEPLLSFDQNIRLVTYGDDLLANVSDAYIGRFNTMTLQNWFATYNIKFTDIDKSGSVIPYRTLDNAPFLKREFVPHPTRSGIYLARIAESSIAGCLNWTHKADDPREAIKQNVNSALDLAFGHGPTYYEQLRKKINDALCERSIYHPTYSWYEIDTRNFDSDNTL